EIWLPWFAVGFLASIAVAVEALFRSRAARDGLRQLTEKVLLLEHRLLRLDERLQALAAPATPPDTATIEPAPPPPQPETAIEQPPSPTPEPQPAAESVPEPVPQPPPAGAEGRRLEQLIVENWMVWLGGLALALG